MNIIRRLQTWFRSTQIAAEQDDLITLQDGIIGGLNDAIGRAKITNDQLTRILYAIVLHNGDKLVLGKDLVEAVMDFDNVGLHFDLNDSGDLVVTNE